MDAVEDYGREVDQDPELESLSDWVRTIRSLVQSRIHKLQNCVNSRPKSVFKDQEAVFPLLMTNMFSFLRTRLPTISCLYVSICGDGNDESCFNFTQ